MSTTTLYTTADCDNTARYIARRDAYEERQYEQPAPALPKYRAPKVEGSIIERLFLSFKALRP